MGRLSLFAVIFCVFALLGACGGGGSGEPAAAAGGVDAPPAAGPGPDPLPGPSTPVAELAGPASGPGLAVFYQYMPVAESRQDYASPGSPNAYILQRGFSTKGGMYQLGGMGALQLNIVQGTATAAFPLDQRFPELTFLTPEETIPGGGAAFGPPLIADPNTALGTSWSGFANTSTIAWLKSSPDSRLQQVLNLPSNPSGPLVLTWQTLHQSGTRAQYGWLADEPFYFRVVLRDMAGGWVETLFEEQAGIVVAGGDGIADVSAHAGRTLVLSFETRTSHDAAGDYYGPGIDNVSLRDGASELVVNGDFEAGATGWTVNAPVTSQNVVSGTRTVAGLEVRRSVYVPVAEKWGRWTDMVSNPGATTMTVEVSYVTQLGYLG